MNFTLLLEKMVLRCAFGPEIGRCFDGSQMEIASSRRAAHFCLSSVDLTNAAQLTFWGETVLVRCIVLFHSPLMRFVRPGPRSRALLVHGARWKPPACTLQERSSTVPGTRGLEHKADENAC